jgi:hypothetical protein
VVPTSRRRWTTTSLPSTTPPDKQPAAIKLVMELLEWMSPRYAVERAENRQGRWFTAF